MSIAMQHALLADTCLFSCFTAVGSICAVLRISICIDFYDKRVAQWVWPLLAGAATAEGKRGHGDLH